MYRKGDRTVRVSLTMDEEHYDLLADYAKGESYTIAGAARWLIVDGLRALERDEPKAKVPFGFSGGGDVAD